MIVLRENYYSFSKKQVETEKPEYLAEVATKRAMKEIIKSIDMNDSIDGERNQEHWIKDKIVKAFLQPLFKSKDSNAGVEIILAGNEKPGWEKLIKDTIQEIRLTEKVNGKPKYIKSYGPKGDLIPPRPVEEWRLIFRYIALCLTGKMNPDVDDFWKSYNKLNSMKANTEKIVRLDPKEGLKIIAKCIDSVLFGQGSNGIKEMMK